MTKIYSDPNLFQLHILRRNPDSYLISPDGLKLYALIPNDRVIEFSGPNFDDMNNEQVNKYIVNSVRELRKKIRA